MVCILSNKSIIQITGHDAKSFLQSIISNDIELINNNGLIYSYIISPQGRFLFDVFIYLKDGVFLLEHNNISTENLIKKLNFIKLRSDVKIELIDNYRVLYSDEKLNSYISGKDPRYKKLGYRTICEIKNIDTSSIEKDILYLKDKYQNTIPDGFIDLAYEKSLIPEFAPEILNSISFSKGCFPGQEVMSRTKYQGQVRKNLFKVSLIDSISEDISGNDVIHNEEKLGYITSSFGNEAIALLKLDYNSNIKEVRIKNFTAYIQKPTWA